MYNAGDKIIINHPGYGHIVVTVTAVYDGHGVEARRADGTEIWVGRALILGPARSENLSPR
jgi:hypothetical protein